MVCLWAVCLVLVLVVCSVERWAAPTVGLSVAVSADTKADNLAAKTAGSTVQRWAALLVALRADPTAVKRDVRSAAAMAVWSVQQTAGRRAASRAGSKAVPWAGWSVVK